MLVRLAQLEAVLKRKLEELLLVLQEVLSNSVQRHRVVQDLVKHQRHPEAALVCLLPVLVEDNLDYLHLILTVVELFKLIRGLNLVAELVYLLPKFLHELRKAGLVENGDKL